LVWWCAWGLKAIRGFEAHFYPSKPIAVVSNNISRKEKRLETGDDERIWGGSGVWALATGGEKKVAQPGSLLPKHNYEEKG